MWIDALPSLNLAEVTFHLVTVAGVADDSPLLALTKETPDMAGLVTALEEEAERVVSERRKATAAGERAPYGDKAAGCEAFLSLLPLTRLNLVRRARIHPDSPGISKIEEEVAAQLTIVSPDIRPIVAARLIQWWDREVVYSLCGKRDRTITRAELQSQITTIIGEIDQGALLADFEVVAAPGDYQPDGMLARQIQLVRGQPFDLARAIREEWRAREQRSKWTNDNPGMRSFIGNYDLILKEHWADRHEAMKVECTELSEDDKCNKGLLLLRWTHDRAPNDIRPIVTGWGAPYYIRGSYQVLAINLEVGWHPEFAKLLEVNE